MSTNVNRLPPRRDEGPTSFHDLPSASEHAGGARSDLLFAYGMFFARSRGHRMPEWAPTCAQGACAGLFAVATATTLAEVDLTPIPSHREVKGAPFSGITFTGSAGSISYSPPRGWKLQGGRGRLNLLPPGTSQAEASITVETASSRSIAMDESGIQERVNALTRRLPPEATDIEVLTASTNPLKIDGRDTLEVGLRYQLFGQAFRTQVILLPAGPELWRLELTSREYQFERNYEPFRESLYSLQGIARSHAAT